MQHLSEAGFEASAFSRSEDNNGQVMVGHGFEPILREPAFFGNQRMTEMAEARLNP
jgi:hypothetical protein